MYYNILLILFHAILIYFFRKVEWVGFCDLISYQTKLPIQGRNFTV